MASPKQLIAGLAEILDIPEATLIVHDRNLAEAGIRKKAKAGRGSVSNTVTAEDAAALIVAAVASPRVRDSADTVGRYSDEVSEIAQFIGTGRNYRPWAQVSIQIKRGRYIHSTVEIQRELIIAVTELLKER